MRLDVGTPRGLYGFLQGRLARVRAPGASRVTGVWPYRTGRKPRDRGLAGTHWTWA